jgi:hypothetical protein
MRLVVLFIYRITCGVQNMSKPLGLLPLKVSIFDILIHGPLGVLKELGI